jgi:hypothetical protein
LNEESGFGASGFGLRASGFGPKKMHGNGSASQLFKSPPLYQPLTLIL